MIYSWTSWPNKYVGLQTVTSAFVFAQVEEIQPGYSKLNYVFLAKVSE